MRPDKENHGNIFQEVHQGHALRLIHDEDLSPCRFVAADGYSVKIYTIRDQAAMIVQAIPEIVTLAYARGAIQDRSYAVHAKIKKLNIHQRR